MSFSLFFLQSFGLPPSTPSLLVSHRKFCDDFASKFGIKYPSDWYHVSEDQLREQPGGATVLAEYNNNLHRCVSEVKREEKRGNKQTEERSERGDRKRDRESKRLFNSIGFHFFISRKTEGCFGPFTRNTLGTLRSL